MPLSKPADDHLPGRIVNLDFLRGFFIILAMQQHFVSYINMWYVEYFRDTMALTSTYAIHFKMIGKQISSDGILHWMAVVFTPWVSQIYLTMAAFNLARRAPLNLKENLNKKLKVFGFIFIYFFLENFIVAPNTGQALSVYPVMLWMVILGIISVVYCYLGIKGVLALTFISSFRFVVPMEEFSNFCENFFINHFHPDFEYDARIEYFILSGCLGFIMGYVHYHLPKYRLTKDIFFMGMGLVLVASYALWGDKFVIYDNDHLQTEHDLARTFTGSIYILGIQSVTISFFLWLEKIKGWAIRLPVINWVGINSLLIFALHRIFFVKLILPISLLFGIFSGRIISASTLEVYIYIGTTLLLCRFVKNSSLVEIVLQRKHRPG